MKHILKLAFLFSFSALAFIGCSSGGGTVTPPPTTTKDSVTYSSGTSYHYTEHARDSTDKNLTTADTITATVVATHQTWQPDSGVGSGDVTVLENTHTASLSGATMDTTYIASQKGGQFWHYNFGLEGFSGFLKGGLGWVLQAKMNAKAGDKWVAKATTSVPLSIAPVNADVTVNATEANDTTIQVGTANLTVKHVIHTVTIQSLGHTITNNIDTYVSSDFGVVATVRHSSAIDVKPYYSGQVPGSEYVMTSHP